jgi:hypothetical protein
MSRSLACGRDHASLLSRISPGTRPISPYCIETARSTILLYKTIRPHVETASGVVLSDSESASMFPPAGLAVRAEFDVSPIGYTSDCGTVSFCSELEVTNVIAFASGSSAPVNATFSAQFVERSSSRIAFLQGEIGADAAADTA